MIFEINCCVAPKSVLACRELRMSRPCGQADVGWASRVDAHGPVEGGVLIRGRRSMDATRREQRALNSRTLCWATRRLQDR